MIQPKLNFTWYTEMYTILHSVVVVVEEDKYIGLDVSELFNMLDNGDKGVERYIGLYYEKSDPKKAFYWYERAACHNDGNAQYILGKYYFNGIIVDRDMDKARYWYDRACQNKIMMAYHDRDIYFNTVGSYARDYKKMVGVFNFISKRKNYKAYNIFDLIYNDGKSVIPGGEYDAIEWLEKASLEGSFSAHRTLADLYFRGKFVRNDDKEAKKRFELAVYFGCKKSYYGLGLCYEYGVGTLKDYYYAYECYSKVARIGYAPAIEKMKEFVDFNKGVYLIPRYEVIYKEWEEYFNKNT